MKKFFEEKKELRRKISSIMENMNTEKDIEELISLFSVYPTKVAKDRFYYTYITNFYFTTNILDLALKSAEEGFEKFKCDYELKLMYFNVLCEMGLYGEAMDLAYISLIKYSYEDEVDKSLNLFNTIVKFVSENCKEPEILIKCSQYVNEIMSLESLVDNRCFPLSQLGKSLVGEVINVGKSQYFIGLNEVRMEAERETYTQIIKGNIIDKEIQFFIEEECVFPICTNVSQYIFIATGEDVVPLPLYSNQINYTTLPKGKVVIKAENKFFLGDYIVKNKIDETKPKLVLNIFVDGLSSKFLQDNGFQSLMPNTYEYFKDSMKFNNCYSGSEWTLPSIATITTGTRANKHSLLHSFKSLAIDSESSIQKILMNNGYYTSKICGNWRITPTYGYLDGFHRNLYKFASNNYLCKNVIVDAIDHMNTFTDTNNYMWMTIESLHDTCDKLERVTYAQYNNSLPLKDTSASEKDISVHLDKSPALTGQYTTNIKYVDNWLGILFREIERLYGDDVVVMLFSDHGQSFIDSDNLDYIFSENRTKVPLLIKAKGYESIEVDDIVETLDFKKILLKILNIDTSNMENYVDDGQLPVVLGGEKKEFAISQVIFPGQTYKGVINDSVHTFVLESKEFVENSLGINLDEYKINLINKETNECEAHIYPEKIEKYFAEIIELTKEMLI